MNKVKLAERVIELCPEVMGMNRTAEAVVSDPRVVEVLVRTLEHSIKIIEKLTKVKLEAAAEIESLRTEINKENE